jgi:cytochrome c oxidase assembly protein subunit 15
MVALRLWDFWLRLATRALVAATLILLALGGTVTSHGAGLAVPDWPTTFGHNMFAVPLEAWVQNEKVFWEHTHRLMGSVVGLLTLGVAGLLWWVKRDRPALVWGAVGAVLLVIVQGVLGGLRVTETSRALAVVHGITGQGFLALAVVLATAVGPWGGGGAADASEPPPMGRVLALPAVLAGQLVLGAWMRHYGASLAIPDFPWSYGGFLPPWSAEALKAALVARGGASAAEAYTLGDVWLHFAHRGLAVAVALLVGALMPTALRHRALRAPALGCAALVLLQLVLGPAVVLWRRPPDLATAHQVGGAALLAAATWGAARLFQVERESRRARSVDAG